MRIIAGTVGGRRLKAPRGQATRPTADRVREAVFNILVARGPVPERVLDLYAGSGALGLEALSRGARAAVFVDESGAACEAIRDNARALAFDGAARVEKKRALDFLRTASDDGGRFGWIFLDPPYAAGEMDRALAALGRLLDEDGLVIAEHEWRAAPKDEHESLALADRRRYGQTAVSFYTSRQGATT